MIIALFYTGEISMLDLGLAAATFAALVALNRAGVMRLSLYLLLGAALWFFVLRSGVHATIAGVLLALTIPLQPTPGKPDDTTHSLLHILEHALQKPVAFLVVPIFGFANAGVSFAGIGLDTMRAAADARRRARPARRQAGGRVRRFGARHPARARHAAVPLHRGCIWLASPCCAASASP